MASYGIPHYIDRLPSDLSERRTARANGLVLDTRDGLKYQKRNSAPGFIKMQLKEKLISEKMAKDFFFWSKHLAETRQRILAINPEIKAEYIPKIGKLLSYGCRKTIQGGREEEIRPNTIEIRFVNKKLYEGTVMGRL